MKSFYASENIDTLKLIGVLNLSKLNCNYTNIKSLAPLSKLRNLQEIWCSGTQVASLSTIESLQNLEVLICFDTALSQKELYRFSQVKSNCLMLY